MDTGSSATNRVMVFADYVCPFSYLTSFALERVAGEHGLDVAWHAFELRPAPAPPGQPASPAEWAMVAEIAAAGGIALRLPAITPRTRKAHEATKFAATLGLQDALRRALFAAYFEEGKDIGRIDVLVDIAGGIGIDRTAMKVTLDVDAYADDVAADAALAQRLEIEGTPAIVAGGIVRMGYMSEGHLRDWLED